MNILTTAKGVALALALAAPAGAATLDFSSLPAGNLNTDVLELSNATLTSGGDSLFNIVGSGICAFNNAFNCQASLDIDFDDEVSNLSFQAFGFDAGDFVLAQAFSSTDTLLASFDVVGNGVYSFGALAGISRLFLQDSSTGAGYSWNNFQFDESGPAPVPLPAALPLMLGGMALAGAFLRRRKA